MNTLIGALLAALILLGTNFMALFAENPNLTFGDIKQGTWVLLIVGALVAFAKDYQAITVRRLANRVTRTGDGGGQV